MSDDFRSRRRGRDNAEEARESFRTLHARQVAQFGLQRDRNDYKPVGEMSYKSLPRVRVYVSLTDPFLGPFINDARQKLLWAYRTGTRHWHHHYIIDIADVTIDLHGRGGFIKIVPADSFYFEFATSGYPVVMDSITQESVTYDSYKGCVVGANVALISGAIRTTASIRKQIRSTNGAELSRIARPFQTQLINEPVAYPNAKLTHNRWRYADALYESYAPGHSHTGVYLRAPLARPGTFIGSNGIGPSSGTHYLRDSGIDVPYQRGNSTDAVQSAYIRGTADFSRANGVQLVTDPLRASREFAIYVDAFGSFAVFPTAAIGAIDPLDPYAQNVDEAYVTRVAPTYPAWVYVPSTKAKDYLTGDPDRTHWLVDEPELDWKFNHLGTKAVTIAYEKGDYANDTAYWAADSNPDQPWNDTKFDALNAELGLEVMIQNAATDAYAPSCFQLAPGVIEAVVTITLTGDNLEDYDVTVNISTKRQPAVDTDVGCPILAGYVWYDIPGGGQVTDSAPAIAKAGDCVIVELELWAQPLGTAGANTRRTVITSVKNIDTSVELFSTYDNPLVQADLTTLSLVFMLRYVEYVYRTPPKRTGGSGTTGTPVVYSVNHFGYWVVHSAVSKDLLYPTTMAQPHKDALLALTTATGRAHLADLQIAAATASEVAWQMVPLLTAKDGWADTPLNDYREWWSFQKHYWYNDWFALIDPDVWFYGTGYPTEGYVKYRAITPSSSEPAYPSDGDDTAKWLSMLGVEYQHMFFCDYPYWGWLAYAHLVPIFMRISAFCTFYTHPNGSYCLWDNGAIYNPYGVPGAAAVGWTGVVPPSGSTAWWYDTLTGFDATQLEHVVFDRVHFEFRTASGVQARANTTFLELYNTAVRAGLEAKTLEAGIAEASIDKLRGVFAKETANDGNNDFLDLKLTWDGASWWFQEQAVLGQPSYTFPPYGPFVGGLFELNTYQFWMDTNYAGAGNLLPPGSPEGGRTDWHVRFANPVIISKLK